MKANKFVIEQNDEAVSPVIAVILMVAITVVLAATVYVWVSGFGTSGAIKKFPQVTLKDDSASLPAAASGTLPAVHTVLAVLEHRGGDTINWQDYTVKVFRSGTQVTNGGSAEIDVDFDTSSGCNTDNDANPDTAFSVGGKLYICVANAASTGTNWIQNDEMKVQIIDENQNSIVYENTVVLS